MQKVATKVFIGSSILFGILGITMTIISFDNDNLSVLSDVVSKLLAIDVFVILSSFALSIAGKYLK